MLQLREEAALEAQSMPDLGRDETEKLAAILEALNLRIFDVPSNGDWYFVEHGIRSLRCLVFQ